MAMPRLDSTGARVRTVSRQIMDDMRYARTLAVTENKDVEVVFSSSTDYKIQYKAISPALPILIKNGAKELALYGINCAPVPATYTFRNNGSVFINGSLVNGILTVGPSIEIGITASTGMVK
jgi:hypothetical protein